MRDLRLGRESLGVRPAIAATGGNLRASIAGRTGTNRYRYLILVTIALLAAMFAGQALLGGGPTAKAATGEVVFLSSLDVGFGAGNLATSFVAAGKTVVYKTSAEWSAMTAAEFDDYDAIVLPDPTCGDVAGSAGLLAVPTANAAVWGSVVDGNVIIIGTDEQFHSGSGGQALMDGAAAFVVADAAKTGAYISLGCSFNGTAAGTAVPMLDAAFGAPGDFTVTGVPGCFNDAHIVATHPALSGVTDAVLSNWSCSVHEAFDAWPVGFEVLANALTGSAYTAPDGTVGTPYILARGVEVISDIDLSPDHDVNNLGETHTVTATVTTDDPVPGSPVVGTEVTFSIVAGPHTGLTATDTTDGSGMAQFSYVGTTVGVDTIEATFVDGLGRTQRSNRVTKEWIEPEVGVDKWWNHTNVCFEHDDDGDGLLNEDGLDPQLDNDGDGVRNEDPVDGIDNDGDGLIDEDGVDPQLDNDGDGLVNEDGVSCADGSTLGDVLEDGEADAVVAKDGTVRNYNPGQVYAITQIDATTAGTLSFVEDWADCLDLLASSPANGGGRLIVVRENADGSLEEILNALDIEEAGGTVGADGASFDLDVEPGTYYVLAKFRPVTGWNVGDMPLPQSCTNTSTVNESVSTSADFSVVEKS